MTAEIITFPSNLTKYDLSSIRAGAAALPGKWLVEIAAVGRELSIVWLRSNVRPGGAAPRFGLWRAGRTIWVTVFGLDECGFTDNWDAPFGSIEAALEAISDLLRTVQGQNSDTCLPPYIA